MLACRFIPLHRSMMSTAILASRVAAELNMLITSPPPGVSCWPVGDSITEFEAGMSLFAPPIVLNPILTRF